MAVLSNDLVDAWLNADKLPVTYVRALIEELDWQRRLPRLRSDARDPSQTPSNELEHPLLQISRDHVRS